MASFCMRWELILTGIIGALIVWGYLVLGLLKVPFPFGEEYRQAADDALLALPGWALMTLGCYALFNIGSALITFRDTPEAGEELKEEEAEARAFFSSPARGKLAFEVGAVPEGEGNGVLGMNE